MSRRDQAIERLAECAGVLNDTDPQAAKALLAIHEKLTGEVAPVGIGAATEPLIPVSEYDVGFRAGRLDKLKNRPKMRETLLTKCCYSSYYFEGYNSGYASAEPADADLTSVTA